MRKLGSALLALFVLGFIVVPLVGCAAQRQPSSTYGVSADGTVAVQTRSATDGSQAPGRQEYVAAYLPLPWGFDLKASLSGDSGGFPIIIGPPAPQVAPQAAAPCVQTTYVEEAYTEMVPVQRTRSVPRRTVTLPVPQAAPQVCPCPPEPVGVVGPGPVYDYGPPAGAPAVVATAKKT